MKLPGDTNLKRISEDIKCEEQWDSEETSKLQISSKIKISIHQVPFCGQ